MTTWLIRFAAIYFMIGVSLGVYMGATHHFEQMPLHAHLNLLGWVSLGLIALIYRSYPRAAQTWLAKAHLVLHNIGLPIMAIGLFLMFGGNHAAEPVVGVGSLMVLLGVLCLGVNLLRNVGD